MFSLISEQTEILNEIPVKFFPVFQGDNSISRIIQAQ